MTLRTTSIAPKKRKLSRYNSSRDPEHGCAKGQEIVAQLVEVFTGSLDVRVVGWRLAKGNEAQSQADHQQRVEHRVEGIPEAQDVVAGLPELGQLVEEEAEGECVQQAFDEIEVAVPVDGVDGARIQAEIK